MGFDEKRVARVEPQTSHFQFAPPSRSMEPKIKEEQCNGERVLFIDDEESLVSLATRILGRLGYVVSGYVNPAEALQTFLRCPDSFDVVVCDLSMPGMSGPTLTEKIRASGSAIPIILMTGFIRPEDPERAREAGASEFVTKPSTVEEMSAVIRRALAKST